MAGCAKTCTDKVLASGFQSERPIERGNAVYVDQRAACPVADYSQRLFGKIAALGLDFFENADESATVVGMLIQYAQDTIPIHFRLFLHIVFV